MRVLVCGGRNYGSTEAERTLFKQVMKLLWRQHMTVIHGAAPGADTLASEYARAAINNAKQWEGMAAEFVHELAYPADWDKHGRAAGPIRNQRMLDEGKPELVVAFPGGTGTADMVYRARAAGIPVFQVAP